MYNYNCLIINFDNEISWELCQLDNQADCIVVLDFMYSYTISYVCFRLKMPRSKVDVFCKKICKKDVFNAVNFVLQQKMSLSESASNGTIQKFIFDISIKEV